MKRRNTNTGLIRSLGRGAETLGQAGATWRQAARQDRKKRSAAAAIPAALLSKNWLPPRNYWVFATRSERF